MALLMGMTPDGDAEPVEVEARDDTVRFVFDDGQSLTFERGDLARALADVPDHPLVDAA